MMKFAFNSHLKGIYLIIRVLSRFLGFLGDFMVISPIESLSEIPKYLNPFIGKITVEKLVSPPLLNNIPK